MTTTLHYSVRLIPMLLPFVAVMQLNSTPVITCNHSFVVRTVLVIILRSFSLNVKRKCTIIIYVHSCDASYIIHRASVLEARRWSRQLTAKHSYTLHCLAALAPLSFKKWQSRPWVNTICRHWNSLADER